MILFPRPRAARRRLLAPLAATLCLAALAAPALAGAPAAPASTVHGINPAYIDRSANPTADFYEYANGAWLKTAQIPDAFPQAGTGMEAYLRANGAVQQLLVTAAADAAGGKAAPGSNAQKVGDYYRIAADEALADKLGATPIQSELDRIEAIASANDVMATLAQGDRVGINSCFGIGVGPDFKDSTRNITELGQGGLGLPDRDYYLKTDEKSQTIRNAYADHIARYFVLLGDKPAGAATEAQTVLAFETWLAKASLDKESLRDPAKNYHLMTLAQLKAAAPAPWDVYLAGIGKPDPGIINVAHPMFFKEFAAMTQSVPVADWKTYLRFHLVATAAGYLSKPFVDENFRFASTLTGQKTLRPRAQRAASATDAALGEAVGQLYIAQNFSPEAKAKALALVLNLKAALSDRIKTLPWMGDATKEQAQRKLDKLTIKIGYPDKWRDYSKFEVKTDSYYANAARFNAFEFERNLDKIGKPVDRAEWGMTPATVNAYYNPTFNEIVFPAAILQPPLFDPLADDASNYGAIGSIIGHEMTHGFDDEGRQFDADGNLKDWWTLGDVKRFDAKAAALAKQYDAYEPVTGTHINGKLTLGENIADLGGLKIAYLAYEKSLGGVKPPLIDGYTGEQRFFLAYAQALRTKQRPEAAVLQMSTDPHSPSSFRVRGPLADTPAFYAAWGAVAPPSAATIW